MTARVLNVNDHAGAHYVTSRILRQHGFEVLEASTGAEALDLARSKRPEVMVLDINLPDISGYEVCRLLKADAETSSIGIIQTSATFVTSANKAQGLQSGADAYLTQPFEAIELVAMIHSLLRMRRAEAEARHRADALAEIDRRKDEFLAMLSHELRNPLAAMTTAISLVEQRMPEDDVAQRLLSTLDRQARHLGRLVDDLLDVSRITQGKIALRRTAVDVVMLVRNVVEATRPQLAKTKREISLEAPSDGDVLVAFGDPTRLEQVLNNVLGNAAKYSEPGGHIDVVVDRAEDGRTVRICVRDDGIGVASEHLPRLFDVFY